MAVLRAALGLPVAIVGVKVATIGETVGVGEYRDDVGELTVTVGEDVVAAGDPVSGVIELVVAVGDWHIGLVQPEIIPLASYLARKITF
jgi:hypothetical protein